MPHKGSNKYAGKELMNAEIWKENKFSVFKNKNFAAYNLQDFQYKLDRVAEYHKLLDTPKELDNPFLFVVGKCYSTVLTIDKDGVRHYTPGDGRVSEVSSYPLDILPNKKIEVACQKHDNQLNDPAIINKIFEFLK
ncbi:MAG: hypothetical protein HY226_00395 [Candidatus Vogelbacteria bacterium]|nr:hypothetical protein [Candidatus Vogelbacteria bacterium]